MGDRDRGVTETAGTPAPVSDLRIVAVTPERAYLVLEDAESRQYRVPVDERLANALRTPERAPGSRRDGQLEIALESQLSPREIQARVRAGHSVDEVAVAAGIATERVERYAVPVLAERAHVVEQAQRAPAGVPPAARHRRSSSWSRPGWSSRVSPRRTRDWDAWRGDEERWTVRVSYLGAAGNASPRGPSTPEVGCSRPATTRRAGSSTTSARSACSTTGRRDPSPGSRPGHPDVEPGRGGTHGRTGDRRGLRPRGRRGRPGQRGGAGGSRARPAPAVPAWEDIMFGPRRRD